MTVNSLPPAAAVACQLHQVADPVLPRPKPVVLQICRLGLGLKVGCKKGGFPLIVIEQLLETFHWIPGQKCFHHLIW